MKRLVNYLRGIIRLSVTGPFPERVVNLCAQNRVDFWAVDWRDEHTIFFTVRSRGLRQVEHFAQRVECQVTVERRGGLPDFVQKFRKRYAFLIGLSLSLCVVGVLSCFVLTVEITGNQMVSDAVIFQQLQRFGVYPGAYGPGLDRRQIEQEILLSLKDLAWMTINLHGTRVEVQVKEKQLAPETVDEKGFFHIISETDGIITQIEPELGDALVQEGDTVAKGDILISGTVTLEPPQYSELPDRYYHLHARGRVWARTWRQITAVIPSETAVKNYVGTQKTVWAINFFGKRVEFFGNSSILDGFYDKITSVRRAALPGGIELPIWLVREEYRRYEPETTDVELNAAAQLLEDALKEYLGFLVGGDGQVLHIEYKTQLAEGKICVSAVGECLEEIGQEIPGQHEM